MVIACLGWGSLIWDPRSLPVCSPWYLDGPLLPIEFARRSSDDRITLVVAQVEHRVRSLWTLLAVPDVDTARSELGRRERVTENLERDIASWTRDRSSDRPEVSGIARWATALEIDGVVWTGLPPGMSRSIPAVPTPETIIRHLRDLPREKRRTAETYIRNAPAPTDTPYRRLVEKELGWTPSDLAYTACGLPRRST